MDERREHKPSRLARGGKTTGRWLVTHPVGALQILAVLLLAIVVLQNLEPTSIDILFWTLVAGGLIWELLRRGLLRRRKASTTPEQ